MMFVPIHTGFSGRVLRHYGTNTGIPGIVVENIPVPGMPASIYKEPTVSISGYRYSFHRNLLNCLVQVRGRTDVADVSGIGIKFVLNHAGVFGAVFRPYRKNTGEPGIL